ncbi:TadE/TadG family type IV pilus assembly protein [Wenxinia marina]|uniref:TadE-like protein n=1 Tax=Wenxinia marina DSM 24838 TaxID=1123501 RepID=A0A0D0Q4F7_9RHOB|nr:TadE/TadG family type IV pilus assembly protein [Wenxinia marina]KIQ69419.1 TadE-like protein [Wenxinia marina DSM 24838]GGL58175.1 hypothetical protein GCM10011392_10780 [Wenxinia marina]
MSRFSRLLRRVAGFFGNDSGAALVEFALALPLFLILFAATVDGARMMWSYQKAAAGVRDATRYLGRTTPLSICGGAGGSVAGRQAQLEGIVRNAIGGGSIVPAGVTVTSVVPSHVCLAGTWRNGPVPIATVTASLEITMPFSGVFQLVGGSVGTFTATITDQTRVFGS